MNFKTFKSIISICLITVLILSFISLQGCNAENFNLYFGIDEMPNNLDPQKASSYSELIAVRNCFKGLFSLDENDNIVNGVIDSYTLSDDKLTYTFYISDKTVWSNGNPITAYDFVFAVERAADPKTAAPSSELIYSIVGAQDCLAGKNTELGIKAINEKTLVITLYKPDANFTYKLTNPVFMPCNKEFFENCGGKYGLGVKYILTNGDYSVKSWSKDSFVRLIKNNDDSKYSVAESVYLSVSSKGKDTISRINDKEIGITVNFDNDYTTVDTAKFNVFTEYQIGYALIFNKNTDLGTNKELVKSLTMSIDREYYGNKMNSRFSNSLSVLSSGSLLFEKPLSQYITPAKYSIKYSKSDSRTLFLQEVNKLKNKQFPKTDIITLENSEIKSVLSDVIVKWHSDLGAYVNIKTVSSKAELLEKLNSGDYTIAFVPLYQDCLDTLRLFSDGYGADIKNTEYNKIIKELNSTDDFRVASDLIGKATEILSKEESVVPIFNLPTAIVYDKEYQNVFYHKSDMTVEFSKICKK